MQYLAFDVAGIQTNQEASFLCQENLPTNRLATGRFPPDVDLQCLKATREWHPPFRDCSQRDSPKPTRLETACRTNSAKPRTRTSPAEETAPSRSEEHTSELQSPQ